VTGNWVSVLATLIPLALVVSISPLSVIPAVLVLQTPRPRPTGLAFLGGWLLGLVALTAVFVASSDALSGLHNKAPAWASWTRVVLGLALIAFGIYRWLTREGHTESPKWMRSFETLTPARALATGLALVVVRVEVSPYPRSRSPSSLTWPPVTVWTIRWRGSRGGWSETTLRCSPGFWS